MLHFAGKSDGEEIAYIGITGMNQPAPEIQMMVADGYRGLGYGKEMAPPAECWRSITSVRCQVQYVIGYISVHAFSERLAVISFQLAGLLTAHGRAE